jgi:hypothetical protein
MWRLAAYLLMAVALWILQGFEGRTQKYLLLSQDGVSAEAIVMKPDCGNHSTFIYHFSVDGREIESRDYSDGDCHQLKPGQTVRIHYLPRDPTISMVGDPTKFLAGERKVALGMSLVLPGLILWAYSRRRERQENS